MSSQYDPIIEQLFEGKRVVVPARTLDTASLRTAFYRRNKERRQAWGKFYKEKTLCIKNRTSTEGRIPELVLFLVDKPPRPVYSFTTLD